MSAQMQLTAATLAAVLSLVVLTVLDREARARKMERDRRRRARFKTVLDD